MELMIAARKVVSLLKMEYGLVVERLYTGSFMTSLDMAGLSITLMKTNPNILARLDAPTKSPCWPIHVNVTRLDVKRCILSPPSCLSSATRASSRPKELDKQGHILEVAIEAAANKIINLKDKLNEWDSKVGDGDCGSTLCKGAIAILEDMKKHYPLNDAAETINEIGISIRRVMGGTSGILYDIFCKAAYTKLKGSHLVTFKQWVDALEASINAVSKYGGAIAGYRTMLDALVPALSVLKERLDAGSNSMAAFVLSSEAAITGAESTKQMLALAGRSSYVSGDVLASIPDPGAVAAASWYRAAAIAIQDKQV